MTNKLMTALADLINTAADQAAEAEDQDELRLWEPWLDAKALVQDEKVSLNFGGETYLLTLESPSA